MISRTDYEMWPFLNFHSPHHNSEKHQLYAPPGKYIGTTVEVQSGAALANNLVVTPHRGKIKIVTQRIQLLEIEPITTLR